MLSHQGVTLVERIRRCRLAAGSMPLGVGFEVPKAPARPSLSLTADPDVKLSTTSQHHGCLHAWGGGYASAHDDNGLNL